jgi:hypothetical protein
MSVTDAPLPHTDILIQWGPVERLRGQEVDANHAIQAQGIVW